MTRLHKGFTLIELMAVIAIIGILLSIVMTATAGAMKFSRRNKAQAIFKCVEEGFNTYHFQNDAWPKAIDSKVRTQANAGNNKAGLDGRADYNQLYLEGEEIRQSIYEILEISIKDCNPLMDVSGLYVSRRPGENRNEKVVGQNFRDAVRMHWRVGDMYYGYPHPDTGYFRRFDVVFAAGSVHVKER